MAEEAKEVNPNEYPKWIETKEEIAKTQKGEPIYKRVLVNDAKEEAAVSKAKPVDWKA